MNVKKFLLPLFLLLFSLSFVSAILPSQEYNKIFLDPFYRQSMDAEDYTYSLVVDSPDGFSDVASAIVTFQMWLNPTIEFGLLVNGESCNNPVYEVHTSYAGAGEGNVFFDCSNIITANGVYEIVLTPDDDTGAVTGWVDLTYSNSPSGSIEVMGTNYKVGDNGRIFIQIVRNDTGFDDAVCKLNVYEPNSTQINPSYYIEDGLMTAQKSDGLYYYDFTAPENIGIYMITADCFIGQNTSLFSADYSVLNEGLLVSGSVNDTFVKDNNYYHLEEESQGGTNRSYQEDFFFNVSGLPTNISFVALVFEGRMNLLNEETIKFQVYNWTGGYFVDLPNRLYSQDGIFDVRVAQTGDGSGMIDYRNASDFVLVRLQDEFQSGDTIVNDIYIDALLVGGTYVVRQPIISLRGGGELNIRERDDLNQSLSSLMDFYFQSLNTSWFDWYGELLSEHYETQDLIGNLSLDLNNDYVSLLSQHNLTQGLIDDFRTNVSDEFDITKSLILSGNIALNDSFVSELLLHNSFVNDLLLSVYTNITIDVDGVSSQVSNIDSDLQTHDSEVKGLISGLDGDIGSLSSMCSANYNSLDGRMDVLESKIDLLLSKFNVVTSDLNLVAETHDCLEGSVWSIEVVATDNFANYLNFEDINCSITTNIWGNAPLNWNVDSFDFTHECGYGNDTITWVVECDEI